jgi:hypothetical protein
MGNVFKKNITLKETITEYINNIIVTINKNNTSRKKIIDIEILNNENNNINQLPFSLFNKYNFVKLDYKYNGHPVFHNADNNYYLHFKVDNNELFNIIISKDTPYETDDCKIITISDFFINTYIEYSDNKLSNYSNSDNIIKSYPKIEYYDNDFSDECFYFSSHIISESDNYDNEYYIGIYQINLYMLEKYITSYLNIFKSISTFASAPPYNTFEMNLILPE